MQQLLERPPLAAEELQVVDSKQPGAATFLAEARHATAAKCFQKSVRELFGRKIHRRSPWMVIAIFTHDRPQYMRFSHARWSAKQQRGRLLPPAARQLRRVKRIFVTRADNNRR